MRTDDRTLHDAARRLDIKVIELLLKYDHDPNRPSPEHEARTAFAELVFNALVFTKRNSDNNLERDAKKAIKSWLTRERGQIYKPRLRTTPRNLYFSWAWIV